MDNFYLFFSIRFSMFYRIPHTHVRPSSSCVVSSLTRVVTCAVYYRCVLFQFLFPAKLFFWISPSLLHSRSFLFCSSSWFISGVTVSRKFHLSTRCLHSAANTTMPLCSYLTDTEYSTFLSNYLRVLQHIYKRYFEPFRTRYTHTFVRNSVVWIRLKYSMYTHDESSWHSKGSYGRFAAALDASHVLSRWGRPLLWDRKWI